MTKHTNRDKIWSTALRIGQSGAFRVEDVLEAGGLPESSRRTAQDTLLTMHELGHLYHTALYDTHKRFYMLPKHAEEKPWPISDFCDYPYPKKFRKICTFHRAECKEEPFHRAWKHNPDNQYEREQT